MSLKQLLESLGGKPMAGGGSTTNTVPTWVSDVANNILGQIDPHAAALVCRLRG